MTMDADQYKEICSEPDVLRRTVIEATARRLSECEPVLADCLFEQVSGAPVRKPAKHDAGPHSDYFLITLSAAELEDVVGALEDMEASVLMDRRCIAEERGYIGYLFDVWNDALLFRRSRPDRRAFS